MCGAPRGPAEVQRRGHAVDGQLSRLEQPDNNNNDNF